MYSHQACWLWFFWQLCNEVLYHVTFKNGTILFLYVYLLSLMIIPLWKLWYDAFNLLLDHVKWSKVTSPLSLVPFHCFHQLWFVNDFWIFHMIIKKIYITKWDSYNKMRRKIVIAKLLQIVTEVYYKVC